MSVWQPIETAPRDGTEILSYDQFKSIKIVWWEAYKDRHEWFYNGDDYVWPTHWMPLPKVP